MLPFRIKKWQIIIFISFWAFLLSIGGCDGDCGSTKGCCCCEDVTYNDMDFGDDFDDPGEQTHKFAHETEKGYFTEKEIFAHAYKRYPLGCNGFWVFATQINHFVNYQTFRDGCYEKCYDYQPCDEICTGHYWKEEDDFDINEDTERIVGYRWIDESGNNSQVLPYDPLWKGDCENLIDPVALFRFAPPSGPIGTEFQFYGPDDDLEWDWDFGDGGTASIQNPKHTYTTEPPDHKYIVTLKVTGDGTSDEESQEVIVDSRAKADFTPSTMFGPAPLTVVFKDKSTYPETWSWDFGDGNTSIERNPTHIYQSDENYTVSLTITGLYLNDTPDPATCVIKVDSDPYAYFTATPTEGPKGTVVKFNSCASLNAERWEWNFGDPTNSTTDNLNISDKENPEHKYIADGTYTVTLKVYNKAGKESDPETAVITIESDPIADFEAKPLSGRSPLKVQFIDKSTYAKDRSWSFGDGKTSTKQSPVHEYINQGSVNLKRTVSLTVTGIYPGTSPDTETKTDYITVEPPSAGEISIISVEDKNGTDLTLSGNEFDVKTNSDAIVTVLVEQGPNAIVIDEVRVNVKYRYANSIHDDFYKSHPGKPVISSVNATGVTVGTEKEINWNGRDAQDSRILLAGEYDLYAEADYHLASDVNKKGVFVSGKIEIEIDKPHFSIYGIDYGETWGDPDLLSYTTRMLRAYSAIGGSPDFLWDMNFMADSVIQWEPELENKLNLYKLPAKTDGRDIALSRLQSHDAFFNFIGHVYPNTNSKYTELVFIEGYLNNEYITKDDLDALPSDKLKDNYINVLTTCWGLATIIDQNPYTGIGFELLKNGVDIVIGAEDQVTLIPMMLFTQFFWENATTKEVTIDDALTEAIERAQKYYQEEHEQLHIDFKDDFLYLINGMTMEAATHIDRNNECLLPLRYGKFEN